ncbi:MAG TPA: hypothetical protein VGQ46_06915 [Thermoanaerobaculia bacterium]|jgi:hypothetical protein|nr:hypothetical protein [Thermoanaerobaculia bacterium]
MSDTREKVAAGLDAAATVIERLGLLDLVVPPVRSRLERIDTEELMDNAVAAIRRTPEILVVLLGSLTVTTGLIVYFIERTAQQEREEERRERSEAWRSQPTAAPARSSAKRRSAASRK